MFIEQEIAYFSTVGSKLSWKGAWMQFVHVVMQIRTEMWFSTVATHFIGYSRVLDISLVRANLWDVGGGNYKHNEQFVGYCCGVYLKLPLVSRALLVFFFSPSIFLIFLIVLWLSWQLIFFETMYLEMRWWTCLIQCHFPAYLIM